MQVARDRWCRDVSRLGVAVLTLLADGDAAEVVYCIRMFVCVQEVVLTGLRERSECLGGLEGTRVEVVRERRDKWNSEARGPLAS